MSDPDLEFLSKCTSEDLDPLVGYLTKTTTELLTISDAYKKHKGDHLKYLDEIQKELSDFGGNTFANLFRGKGVSYRMVASEVAKKLKAKVPKTSSIEQIEWAVLEILLKKSMEKMNPEEREQVLRALDELGAKGINLSAGRGMAAVALQGAISAGGFTAYELSVVVANGVAKAVLNRGLSFAANAGLTRVIGIFAGPIGWAITGLWTMIDLAGPAYRVTIPCVVQVAMLRFKVHAQEFADI